MKVVKNAVKPMVSGSFSCLALMLQGVCRNRKKDFKKGKRKDAGKMQGKI